VFHPNGRWLVSDDMAALSRPIRMTPGGDVREIQSESTLPKIFTGKNTDAEGGGASRGKFVFCSNRGDDSIAVFGCDSGTDAGRFSNVIPREARRRGS